MEKDVDLNELKKAIVGDSSKGPKGSGADQRVERKKTIESVDEIVRRVAEKYREEGAYIKEDVNEVPEIDVNKILKPDITVSGNPSDLAESDNGIIRLAGKIYLRFKGFFDAIIGRIANSEYLKNLDWDLYAAGMPFTGSQYLALTLVIATIVSIVAFFVGISLFITKGPALAAFGPVALAFLSFIITYVFARMHPRSVAVARSRAAEKYLPFALRHLAVEVRAGMGLYQAMRAVANADYGVLSEEFRRTLREIDQGKSMEVALSNLASRSMSRGLRRAVASILRAVRIGGNLSDTIMAIARDVSFEQRQKVAAYSEKLNFFGVLFMFVGVVFPVMLAMLTTIGYAPTSGKLLAAFRFPPALLTVAFVIGFPGFLLLFYMFVRVSDPMR